MKSGRYASTKALCPYYKCQDAQKIYCTGLQPGHVVHQAFSTPRERKAFCRLFCEDKWDCCPLSIGLNEKIEGASPNADYKKR